MASMKDIMSTTGQTVKAGVAPVAAVGRGGKKVVRGVAKAGAAVAGGVAATAAALQDPDEFAYQAAKGALLAGGAKILGIGKKVFADNKEKKEAKDKHDTLHKDASKGSPERQPMSDAGFDKFGDRLFTFMGKLVKESQEETKALGKEELRAKESAAENKKVGAGKLERKRKKDKKQGGFDWWRMLLFGGVGLAVFWGVAEFKKVLDDWQKTYDKWKDKIKSFTNIFTKVGDKIKNFLKSVGIDFDEDEDDKAAAAATSGQGTDMTSDTKVLVDAAKDDTTAQDFAGLPETKKIIAETKVIEKATGKLPDIKEGDFGGDGDDTEAPTVVAAQAKKAKAEVVVAEKKADEIKKESDKVIKEVSSGAGSPEKQMKDAEKAGAPKEVIKILEDSANDEFENRQAMHDSREEWVQANSEYLHIKKQYEKERMAEVQRLQKGDIEVHDIGEQYDIGDKANEWKKAIDEIRNDKELTAEEKKEELAELGAYHKLKEIDEKYEANLVKLAEKRASALEKAKAAEKVVEADDKKDEDEDKNWEKEIDKLAKDSSSGASKTQTSSTSVTGSAGGQKTQVAPGVTKTAGANQTTSKSSSSVSTQGGRSSSSTKTSTETVTGGGSTMRTAGSDGSLSGDDKRLEDERAARKIIPGLMRAKRQELGISRRQSFKDPRAKAFRAELKKMSIEDLKKLQAEVLPPMNAGDMKGEVATGGGKAIQDAKRLAAIQANAKRGTTNPDATLHAANHAQGS